MIIIGYIAVKLNQQAIGIIMSIVMKKLRNIKIGEASSVVVFQDIFMLFGMDGLMIFFLQRNSPDIIPLYIIEQHFLFGTQITEGTFPFVRRTSRALEYNRGDY